MNKRFTLEDIASYALKLLVGGVVIVIKIGVVDGVELRRLNVDQRLRPALPHD